MEKQRAFMRLQILSTAQEIFSKSMLKSISYLNMVTTPTPFQNTRTISPVQDPAQQAGMRTVPQNKK